MVDIKLGSNSSGEVCKGFKKKHISLLFPIIENKYLANFTMMDKMHATLPGQQ